MYPNLKDSNTIILEANAFNIPKRIKKSKNVLILKDKKGRGVFVNTIKSKPLLIRKGLNYVNFFCQEADQIKDTSKLVEKYPKEKNLIQFLLAHDILIDESDNERKSITQIIEREDYSQLKNQNRNARSEMSLYLLLSQSCNLKCIYCLNGQKTYQKTKSLMMPEVVAFRAIDVCLQSLSPGGRLEIVFFGGEPLLNWPLVKSCVAKCEKNFRKKYKDRQINYHLTTNLSIFPDDLTEWAVKHKFSFLVDIDGPAVYHNLLRPFPNKRPSHSIVSNNIKRLADKGFKVSLRATITSHNVNVMQEIAQHHLELGVNNTAFVALSPVNSDEFIMPQSWYPDPQKYINGLKKIFNNNLYSPENLFPINEYLRKIDLQTAHCIACGAPFGNTPTVAVNGDVYPCIYWVGISRLKMCNIFDPFPFKDSMLTKKLIHELHVDNIPQCRKCAWRYMCGGGCPVYRVLVYNNPYSHKETIKYVKDITCKTSKEMLSMLIWDRANKQIQYLKNLGEHREENLIINTNQNMFDSKNC